MTVPASNAPKPITTSAFMPPLPAKAGLENVRKSNAPHQKTICQFLSPAWRTLQWADSLRPRVEVRGGHTEQRLDVGVDVVHHGLGRQMLGQRLDSRDFLDGGADGHELDHAVA